MCYIYYSSPSRDTYLHCLFQLPILLLPHKYSSKLFVNDQLSKYEEKKIVVILSIFLMQRNEGAHESTFYF